MKKILFMLSKHPRQQSAGDIVMSRLEMNLARESFSVSGVALVPNGFNNSEKTIAEIPKPEIQRVMSVAKSIFNKRSAIHDRFNVMALREFLLTTSYDRYIAEHSYMAEAYLSSRGEYSQSELVVSTHVPESLVLKGVHPVLGIIESKKLSADELRVAQAASSVGCFDDLEANSYLSAGEVKAQWLDLTMPPKQQLPISNSNPFLAFVGDLSWMPNKIALDKIIKIWPRISRRVPGSRLLVIGRGTDDMRFGSASGIEGLGYVQNLERTLGQCRALVAPISVGGGVRVKILEAASMGLPVVGTATAIGSLSKILPLTVSDSTSETEERIVQLLSDRDFAVTEAKELFEANASRWHDKLPHKRMAEFIG